MLSPRTLAAGLRVGRPALALPRLSEGATYASVAFVVYLVIGAVLAIGLNFVVGDAWSRIANASYVLFSRDPHLSAIGFVWNPLPSLLAIPLLPLKAVFPALVNVGFLGNVYSALFMAGAIYLLWGILVDLGVRRWLRLLIVVAFAVHPMIVQYGANGMTEAPFIFLLMGQTRYLIRWLVAGGVMPLVVSGSFLGAAYLVRYEALAVGITTGLLVLVVGVLQASGTWRFRVKTAIADAIVYGTPLALTFILWAGVSWLIVGNPFEQFASVYGTTAQLAADYENIIYRASQGQASVPFLLGNLLILEPFVILLGLVAVAMSIWRRDVRALPILAIFGSVLAFALAAFLTGKTGGWVRYYITVVPLTVLLAAVIVGARPKAPVWVTDALRTLRLPAGDAAAGPRHTENDLARRLRSMTAVVLVLMLLSPIVTTSAAMMSPRFVMAKEFADDRGRVRAAHGIAASLDELGLPEGSVLVDVFLGFGIVTSSEHPRQFVITSDRDFKAILADPAAFEVEYLLVPPPGRELGELDAINRAYPSIYDDGAGIATLVREYSEYAPYFAWRLYRVND